MADNLIFRRIVPADFEKLHPLFSELFDVDLDVEYWQWKYERNPCGKKLCCLGETEGRIVGEVSAIPVDLQCGAETLAASQTCDIAFLPKYRKGASSLKAYKKLMQEHEERDIGLCYGFSVPVTEKISCSLFKFRPVCFVKRWTLIINPADFLREKFKLPIVTRFAGFLLDLYIRLRLWKRRAGLSTRIEEVDRFDERFDEFWEKRKRDYEIMVARKATYLNWRYFDNPLQSYKVFACVSGDRIRGYIVLTIANSEEVLRGVIMDILYDPRETQVLDSLISVAIDYFRRKKVVSTSFWLPEANPLGERLKSWGFVSRDTHHKLIIRLFEGAEALGSDRFMDRGNWYFTMGDSDYH